ncbi:MAG: methyltransferase domain-containing protein [Deferribacterota bacterium]|nr:methyltransferase domain-containing protein [Deferribacterota bacterium]
MITIDFNRLSIKSGDKVLDIGCGTGRHSCAASRFDGVVVIGADLSLQDLVEAKNKLNYEKAIGVQGNGIWGISAADITSLPFKSESFDLVICSEVLEHIHDHKKAISEIMRVLKQGKDLVISVPRYWPERACWAFSQEYHNVSGGHVRIYKRKELIALLQDAGARKWAEHYAHALHSPYWWLKCLVGPTRNNSRLLSLYHRMLVWDMMKSPWATRLLDKLLNPVMGKSLVLYFRKVKNV